MPTSLPSKKPPELPNSAARIKHAKDSESPEVQNLNTILSYAKECEQKNDLDNAISYYMQAANLLQQHSSKASENLQRIYLFTHFALVRLLDKKLEEIPKEDPNYWQLNSKLLNYAVGLDIFEGEMTSEEEMESIKTSMRRAKVLHKVGYWQRARTVYINCANELTRLRYIWSSELFYCLTALTASHTLEGQFYLFCSNFLGKYPEKNDPFDFTEKEKQDLISLINKVLITKTETFLILYLLRFLGDPRVRNLKKYIPNEIIKLEDRDFIISELAENNLTQEAIYYNTSNLSKNNETILRLPRYRNNQCIGYGVYTGTFVGEGSYGSVYKLIENKELSSGKSVSKTPPLIVKICGSEVFNPAEFALASRYSYVEPAIQGIKGTVLVPMQNLGEMNLDKFFQTTFKSLSYLQRLTLRAQISCELNLLHHNTPSTGPALIHGDIKHPNFMVSYAKGQTDVRVIDFGFAQTINDDSTKLVNIPKLRGSQGFIAPETYQLSQGLKSDIVSQASISASCIGAADPLKDKYELLRKVRAQDPRHDLSGIKYNLEGITANYPDFLKHMTSYEEAFLRRMEMKDYTDRPDQDEVLCWDITTRLYAELKTKRHNNQVGIEYEDELKIYEAKLILLSKGLWRTEIGKRTIPQLDKNSEIKDQEAIKTCAQYDFGAQPLIAHAIVKSETEGMLSTEKLKQLMQYTPAALHQAVAIVTEKKFDSNEMKDESLSSDEETKKFNSYQLSSVLLNLFIPINPNFDLSKSQLWKTYNLLHDQRNEIINLFGEEKFTSISEKITRLLVENLTKYKTKKTNYGQKSSYEKMKKSLGDTMGAHTTVEKEVAADALITAIKDHNFKPLLKKPKVMAALQQGKLAEEAAPAINYFLWKAPGAA